MALMEYMGQDAYCLPQADYLESENFDMNRMKEIFDRLEANAARERERIRERFTKYAETLSKQYKELLSLVKNSSP